MSTPPQQSTPAYNEAGAVQPRAYMYMTVLERKFGEPMQLLQSFQIPFQRRKRLLKNWHNDRSRYLAENCRDMDYMNDPEMDGLLHAMNIMRQQPRRYV